MAKKTKYGIRRTFTTTDNTMVGFEIVTKNGTMTKGRHFYTYTPKEHMEKGKVKKVYSVYANNKEKAKAKIRKALKIKEFPKESVMYRGW